MPTLYIIRGLPGSGKTTLANKLNNFGAVDSFWEADHFMRNSENEYEFDPSKLEYCHEQCKTEVELDMRNYLNIAVSNTFTTEKEVKPYLDLAKKYGYAVVSLIVENRHGNESVHNVPDYTMQKMRERFSVKL